MSIYLPQFHIWGILFVLSKLNPTWSLNRVATKIWFFSTWVTWPRTQIPTLDPECACHHWWPSIWNTLRNLVPRAFVLRRTSLFFSPQLFLFIRYEWLGNSCSLSLKEARNSTMLTVSSLEVQCYSNSRNARYNLVPRAF